MEILQTTEETRKWGYDKGEKYILNLVDLIKSKYKVYDDVLLLVFHREETGDFNQHSSPNIFAILWDFQGLHFLN